MDNNIFVEGLCKKYDGFVLDHVSFRVPKGRIIGFIGENGAGKSTTISLILDELKKDGGKVEIFGMDHQIRAIKEKIGVVFDECNFHDVFTAGDMEKILSGVYKSWDRTLYRNYLERFGLPRNKQIGSFSKGMKMKLSIICALAHKPELLILDEATTGLDPVVRYEILDLFLEFIRDKEHSVFFSSHITSDIQKIADDVVLIHQGRIIFEESKSGLVHRYGIARCRKGDFPAMSPDDYIAHRMTGRDEEFLVSDREAMGRKYKDIRIEDAALEDIMLFYIKGGVSCGD